MHPVSHASAAGPHVGIPAQDVFGLLAEFKFIKIPPIFNDMFG
jgi:hypothetical protein